MDTRTLGAQGLAVSSLGLGCVGMSWMYGVRDDVESTATLQRAIELGITLLDTAEVYGPFENERLLGRALRGRRDRVLLSTKFGFSIGATGQIAGVDSRPESIRRAVDGSLERLQTDHIDLLYQHQPDPRVAIEEVVGVMGDLVRQGKVRYLGLSNAGSDSIRRAHAVHPISALQSEYSLWERGIEREVLPTLRELGIGLVAYSPLGRGFITGTAQRAEDYPPEDYRSTHPRFQGANFDRNMAMVDALRPVAAEKEATLSQLALAWLLAQGPDVVPIPGTKRRKYLEENVASCSLELTENDLRRIDAIATPDAIVGTRYRAGEERSFEDF